MTKVKCPKCGVTNPGGQAKCGQCGTTLPRVRVQQSSRPKPPPRSDPGRSDNITFQKGQVIARRYTIQDVVGRGGMGCIYRVYDNTLKEEVALKTLLPQYVQDKLVVDRFFNEARIARQLSHPGIVRVHDIGIAERTVYISMELLKGRSLRGMIDALGPGQRLSVKTTLQIMIQLCTALEYAHQFTVHRDIKPENVMITPDGAVKLMDFGISKLMTNQQLTGTAVIMGTPHYMSPEQVKDSRNVDARADVYSIGVMLYEILTGNLPTGVPKPASQIMKDIPPALDPIVARCVEPDPIDRYQNVSDLKQALSSVLAIVEGGGTLKSRKPEQRETVPTNWRKVVGAVLIVVLLLLTGVGVWGMTVQRTIPLLHTDPGDTGPVPEEVMQQARYARAMALLHRAQTRTAGLQLSPDTEAILARAQELAGAAAQVQNDDPIRGEAMARQALQCYLAIIEPTPKGMRFILPHDIGENGFYIDTTPVTLAEFAPVAAALGWRDYTGLAAEAGDAAVTNIPFYAALAYATAMKREIPTASEWDRAFNVIPEYLATDYNDWTRTPANGPAVGGLPEFGDPIIVKGARTDEDGAITPVEYSGVFEMSYPYVAFRCVQEMPTNLDEVEARLSP